MYSKLISTFFIINSIIIAIVIIIERRQPEKTIAWILFIILVPPIGLLAYIFLGVDWKKHKLNSNPSSDLISLMKTGIRTIDNINFIELINLAFNNSHSPLFINNDVTIFNDGESKFHALFDEISKAKHHIHLEYFIVKNDDIGTKLKNLLIQKASEGVQIRFIIDRIGSKSLPMSYLTDLRASGIDVIFYSYFLTPFLKLINTQINYRNHRKIVVIDGYTGFLGGFNVGDEYLGKGPLGFWRDTHLMFKGDFVLALQGVFLEDFITIKKANDEVFLCDDNVKKYFPTTDYSGSTVVQFASSGPDSIFASIEQIFFKMINMAKDYILITSPYFVPTECILNSLKVAILSGVKVKFIFPGKPDHIAVYFASKTYLVELLKLGAEIYIYNKESFIHSKVIVVDGEFCTVGTANMDRRSYLLNYELNAIIYDIEISKQLEKAFFDDIKVCTKMDLVTYESIPFYIKFFEGLARIFSSLL